MFPIRIYKVLFNRIFSQTQFQEQAPFLLVRKIQFKYQKYLRRTQTIATALSSIT